MINSFTQARKCNSQLMHSLVELLKTSLLNELVIKKFLLGKFLSIFMILKF